MGDDFAYAPLAEAWADPGLYPGDDQLHTFTNHAWAYTAVYWLAKSAVGVGPGFWLAVVTLSVVSVLALRAIMTRFGAAGVALPLALAVSVLVTLPGVGRGIYGGFFGSFFHHQWIALALVMWAFVAVLGGRAVLAGLALGAAAYAQPMSALHGALAIAVACATQGRAGLKALIVTGAVAMLAALPFEYAVIASILNEPGAPVPTERLIEGAYLFRTPRHYALEGADVLLGWGYLALGLISAALLRRSRPAEALMALGLLGGLGALHGIATVFYFATETRFLPVFILDATRSSPLFFTLSATLFATVLERRTETGLGGGAPGGIAALAAVGAIALTLLIFNATPGGWFFALAGLLVLATPGRAAPKAAMAGLLVVLFGASIVRIGSKPQIDPQRLELFDWAGRESAPDALFIVPPGMLEFRLFARRSVYVDFKLFSVAQPQQAWMTRTRIEQIAQPDAETLAASGWEGIVLWDQAFLEAADCTGIARLLDETGADYLVRQVRDAAGNHHAAPDCGAGPAKVFANAGYAVYDARR